MKEYWLIKTIDDERSSSYKFIAESLEEAEANRMNFCGWYCERGDVTIVRVDQEFHTLEEIQYWHGKVFNHVIYENKELEYIIRNGKKENVRNLAHL